MTIHGFNIGIDRFNKNIYLSIKAIGTLTHNDYEKMTPLLNSAIKGIKEPKIKALVDLSEFDGWELRAAWDDLKIGLEHDSEFEKIAIFGNNKKWLEYGIKVTNWFTSGEIEQFETIENAKRWLNG